jgi:hypothetical protein
MLEFRLIEYFNRNYNTIEKTFAKQVAITLYPVFTALAVGAEIADGDGKTSSTDCFPIIEY